MVKLKNQKKEEEMTTLAWTMNCVLFGAKVAGLLKQGRRQEATKEIKNLSSEFNDTSANYLVKRLEEQEQSE